jgi:restriction system protein
MSNGWMVRPMPHGMNQMRYFLDNNRIAVGYPIGQELSQYNNADIRKLLKQRGWEGGIGNVIRLVHQMRPGHLVVVPDDNGRDVYFGKIVSDYLYEASLDVDQKGSGFPHQRQVEWYFDKNPISRSELPDALLKSLRFPGTVAELTKHLPIIAELVGETEAEAVVGGIENEDLFQKAIHVLGSALDSKDIEISLRAAEIVLRYGKSQPR